MQPDDYTGRRTPGKCDASSPRWAELLEEAGYPVRWVDVCGADILEQLRGNTPSLPLYPDMTDDDVRQVVDGVGDFCDN